MDEAMNDKNNTLLLTVDLAGTFVFALEGSLFFA
jgi:hypothetical protein